MSSSSSRTQTPPWEAFASLLGDGKSSPDRWHDFGRDIIVARHVHDVTDGAHELIKLARFNTHAILGRGGCGIVFQAQDPRLDRLVALKFCLAATSEAATAMEREAKLQARVSHPNVVTVYDVDRHDNDVYFVMEYVDGRTVRDLIDSDENPTWREVLAIYRDAGEGLAAAHKQGVRHSDFKPSNVLLDKEGRAKVADFGLARMMAEHRPTREVTTEDWLPYGTPSYMPPETLEGKRGDARSDQWSFCVSVWETLDGEVPFPGLTRTTLLESIAKGPRVINVDVPERVRDVLRVGLAVDPCNRHPDMDTLVAELARLVATDSESEPLPEHAVEIGTSMAGPPEPAPEPDEVRIVDVAMSQERVERARLFRFWAVSLGGAAMGTALVLGVFFGLRGPESKLDAVDEIESVKVAKLRLGVAKLDEANLILDKKIVTSGDTKRAYELWLESKPLVVVSAPTLIASESLDLARRMDEVEPGLMRYARMADYAARKFRDSKSWTRAAEAACAAARFADAAGDKTMAVKQKSNAATFDPEFSCKDAPD